MRPEEQLWMGSSQAHIAITTTKGRLTEGTLGYLLIRTNASFPCSTRRMPSSSPGVPVTHCGSAFQPLVAAAVPGPFGTNRHCSQDTRTLDTATGADPEWSDP